MHLTRHFERIERQGRWAAGELMERLARTGIVVLLRELPVALLLLRPSEREQLALLRARIRRQQIGTCERVLRRFGRWVDDISRWSR